MSEQAQVKLDRGDADAYRLLVAGRIGGFALKLSNGKWGLFDAAERRLSRVNYHSARLAAAALERRLCGMGDE